MNLEYPNMLDYISDYNITGRTESSAFLMWYLEKYYRLDPLEASDSVCDNNGDKGIDGIYLNESEGTIDVFQSKIIQNNRSKIGDTVLKEFYGTLSQFDNKSTLQNLITSAGNALVTGLIDRLDLLDKLDAYEIRGIFICNSEIDANGTSYLNSISNIEFIGKNNLELSYISDERIKSKDVESSFEFTVSNSVQYYVDSQNFAVIAPIKACELVNLSGINDQSIFSFNVRGTLGRTKVNMDIVKSIKNQEMHKKFPLFHNGITIIVEKLDISGNTLIIHNYFVVNGCQSLTTLYSNKDFITDELKILTRFVQVDNLESKLLELITQYSNNQNGVKPRDFKSNNAIQIRLQNEFNSLYGEKYYYEIKRGENIPDGKIVIENGEMGILLWSFDLKEPWGTHRRYQVFEDRYAQLFARPEVNADRILMLKILNELIVESIPRINNQLFGQYALTRHTILYILRQLLEEDETGQVL